MKYFLSDFVYMGASFRPKSKPRMLGEDEVLVYGDLILKEKHYGVAVKTKKGGVPYVVGGAVFNETSNSMEKAYQDIMRLKQLRREAFKRNVNGFREIVNKRSLFSFLLLLEFLILIVNSGMAVFAVIVRGNMLALFMLIVCIVAMKILYKFRWCIVPYGTLRSVGYGVIEYKKE